MQAQYEQRNQFMQGLLCCSVIISLCTMNSDALGDSITLSNSKHFRNEAKRYLGNGDEDLCASSQTLMKMFVAQDENKEEDIASMLINHRKRPVRLNITALKRHLSNIELEEIPEEYE